MDKYEKLLDMLMDFNENIRFAAVCNNDGAIEWHSQRTGTKNMVPLTETKKAVKRAISSWDARKVITENVGRGMYSIAAYEKIKRVTIPIDKNHLLFLSLDNKTKKRGDYGKVAPMGKIMSIVDFISTN